ncbi:hypothetical protein HDV00_002629 [Rhizophlyctis rosea]|nr:hypothetical protein HDV00_002629 [Rhizophlyctis rosea]
MASKLGYAVLSIAAVVFAVLYPGLLGLYRTGNLFRPLPAPFGVERCKVLEQLSACEDIVVHHESGIAYMTCGSPAGRMKWWPPIDSRSNTDTSVPIVDQLYAYNIEQTAKLVQLSISNYPSSSDLVLHGLNILPSPDDPTKLYIFLINHRRQGSTIELFTHTINSNTIKHQQTYSHPLLVSPNSIAPLSPTSFLVTNDFGNPTGIMRQVALLLKRPGGNVQFHSFDKEVNPKIVARDIVYPNGIAYSSALSTVYVCATTTPEVQVYSYDADYNRLRLKERIALPSTCDNLHIDPSSGHIYTAGVVNPLAWIRMVAMKDISLRSTVAARALRIVNNTGEDVFYGRKYKVEPLFVSDGKFVGGGWGVAAPDEQRSTVLIAGPLADGVAVCKMV